MSHGNHNPFAGLRDTLNEKHASRSPEDHLAEIQIKNAHRDTQHVENTLQVGKEKNLLITNIIYSLKLYFFFTLTKQSYTTDKYRFDISQDDWEDREANALMSEEGSLDLRKCRFFTEQEILALCKNPKNCFLKVAKLKETKYTELVTKMQTTSERENFYSGMLQPQRDRLLLGNINVNSEKEDLVTAILQRLGLHPN